MAESNKPTIPEDFYWVAYLREDIQDLRQDQRHEAGQIRAEVQSVRSEVQESRQESREETKSLRSEAQEIGQRLRGEMQEMKQEMLQQMAVLAAGLEAANKRSDSRFTVMMSTMIGLAGVIIAVVKL